MQTLGVLGIRPHRRRWLQRIGKEIGFDVVSLLPYSKVRKADSYDIDVLLDEARSRMREQHVDAISTYWDFPSSCLVPILAEEFGLPTPGLRATLTFEHKLWSRLVQQEVAPKDTPPFVGVDVFDDAVLEEPPLPYPFWLKPVKSYGGHLSFRVRSHADLHHAVMELRRGIGRLGTPFQQVLDRVDDLPEPVAVLDGSAAIAEGLIDGDQCTLEGHVHNGDVSIHGIFDIHRADDGVSFTHYYYPSQLPHRAREQMREIATDLVQAANYHSAAFNIEFFVDDANERTWILEVNPRISQEHAHLMDWVDDATNLQVMSECALGRTPTLEPGDGSCTVAAKFFVRRTQDAIVQHVPDEAEVDRIQQKYAPCEIELLVHSGIQLSAMPEQEPYSYVLAYVHLGAHEEQELHDRFAEVVEELSLTFVDLS